MAATPPPSHRRRSVLRFAELLFRAAVLAGAVLGVRRQLRQLRKDLELADIVRDRVPVEPVLKNTPLISVLAGAWNPEEDLNAFIAGFRGIQYPNKELILAVGGAHCRQDYEHLAGDDVILVDNPGGGKTAALAHCLVKARGDILTILDADCVPTSQAFLSLVAPVVNGEEQVTTGASEPLRSERDSLFVQLQWSSRAYDFATTPAHRERLRGKCYTLRRSALEATGGFNAKVIVGEDYYLGHRLGQEGYRIAFTPGCLVETNHHRSIAPYVRQRSRWLRAVVLDGYRLRRYGDVVLTLRGSVIALGILVITASLPFTRQRGFFLLLLPLLRSYLMRWRYIKFAGRLGIFKPGAQHLLGLVAHIYIDLVASALTLFEYPFKRLRDRW